MNRKCVLQRITQNVTLQCEKVFFAKSAYILKKRVGNFLVMCFMISAYILICNYMNELRSVLNFFFVM